MLIHNFKLILIHFPSFFSCQTASRCLHAKVAGQARESSYTIGAGIWLPSADQGLRGGWRCVA